MGAEEEAEGCQEGLIRLSVACWTRRACALQFHGCAHGKCAERAVRGHPILEGTREGAWRVNTAKGV